jgi:uncharacterized protein (TIGR00730 family)
MDIAVFGSSHPRESDEDYAVARELGRAIAGRGARVFCGGHGGVMEAAGRGAAEAGGASVGVVLAGGPAANAWVTETFVARDLSERLRRLRDVPDAWIVLPRGLGTLLEIVWIAESIVKADTRSRPLVFLGEFWRPVVSLALSEASTAEGSRALRSALRAAATPAEAAEAAMGRSAQALW